MNREAEVKISSRGEIWFGISHIISAPHAPLANLADYKDPIGRPTTKLLTLLSRHFENIIQDFCITKTFQRRNSLQHRKLHCKFNLRIDFIPQCNLRVGRCNGEGEDWPPALICRGQENDVANTSIKYPCTALFFSLKQI